MSDVGGLHPDKAYRDETGESRSSGSGQDGGAYRRDQDPGQVPEEEETGWYNQCDDVSGHTYICWYSVTMSVGVPTSVEHRSLTPIK